MRCTMMALLLAACLAGCSEMSTASSFEQKPTATAAPSRITTAVLLDEMTDLRRLTKLPKPAYTTKQFSSYDRASKSPTENWFANQDWGQFLRVEERAGRQEHVMMDAEGPGAMVRIWSANPDGVLRIYLDGADKPAIEAPMKELLGGRTAGIPSPLSGERSKGWNLYFPIAYARQCKITSDKGGFYYHVNYRTYDKGTDVVTFNPADLTSLAGKIQDVAARLSDTRKGGGPPAERKKTPFDVQLAPGKEATLNETNGPKAICGFLVHLGAVNLQVAARTVVLNMEFDGERTVDCPIGDFFGMAPGIIPYASLPLGVTETNPADLWCHWWMPFGKKARITVRNLGDQNVHVHGAVAVMPYDWDDRSLLLHAKWRITRDLPGRPFSDWTHLQCAGTGRFVGGALHIVNFVRPWWGEGDEKIYVDGETFPSHFGTGTEDYYGYAWCSPERFVHAYHNQPNCDGPGNYGNTTVNRFHIIDDIPFNKSFRFDIENWHGDDNGRTTRAAVSYWYARPDCKDTFKPLAAEDVKYVEVPPWTVKMVKGAQEGEKLKVLEKTGNVGPQQLNEAYSNETQLWWQQGKPGDKLVLAFNSEVEGVRHVIVRLTHASDYGKVQLYVNGEKAGDVQDLYKDGHYALMPEQDLGAFPLKKGQNTLTVEIVGANEKSQKGYMFGLDYLMVK